MKTELSSAVGAPEPPAPALSEAEHQLLLDVARHALREAFGSQSASPAVARELTPALRAPGACFVTLTCAGALRGCIGHLQPRLPLWEAVRENTNSAARNDPRFAPLSAGELAEVHIEISVLTPLRPRTLESPADLLAQLEPGRDGVLLEVEGQRATFLPQVWEHLPAKVDFLNHLARKAGLPEAAWRDASARVSTYHVTAFGGDAAGARG